MGRKSLLLFFVVLLCLPTCSHAQAWSGILDPTRAIDWSTAGLPGGIPARTTICATINASTYGNGSTDASGGIQSALNSCPSGQAVSLSAGTFRLDSGLSIPSNVTLRGQGANQTTLNSEITNGPPVSLGSYTIVMPPSNSVSITGGMSAGSTSVTVSSASGISVGSYLIIDQKNSGFVTSTGSEGTCTWCDGGQTSDGSYAQGQISQVTSVTGTTVGISPGLFVSYTNAPVAIPFSATASYAGVENLQVYANNTHTSGNCSNFAMEECAYCWISGVEGNYTDGDHVDVDWSYHGEIVNSYFSNSYLHSPGTYDSDVDLKNKSTGMLVANNILERLHSNFMLEWGAAGNVIAYNYSFGEFDSGSPNYFMPNLGAHGAHPQFNLFEGNVLGGIDPDDSIWGSEGDDTSFRNWAIGTTKICNPMSGRGTVTCSPMGAQGTSGVNGWWAIQANRAIQAYYLARNDNFVGDVAGSATMAALNQYNNPTDPMGQIALVVAPSAISYDADAYGYAFGYTSPSDPGGSPGDTSLPYTTGFFHGEYNEVNGTTTWATGITHTLPASFYMSSKPSWWTSSTPYPAIGPDVTGGPGPGGHTYPNPAENCYTNVMGGTDGTGSPLTFNAASCYGGGNQPAAPTNLTASPH